jgi:hypothetical protein
MFPSCNTESLQEACKQIQQVASWDEYFARIGVQAPTRDELTEWYVCRRHLNSCPANS